MEWQYTVGGVARHCWWSGNIMLVEWQHTNGGVSTHYGGVSTRTVGGVAAHCW